MLYLSKLHQN